MNPINVRRRIHIAVLLIVVSIGAPIIRAEESLEKLIRLPMSVSAAAVDHETGDVAIVSATQNQLWVVPSAWFDDPSPARLQSVELPGRPHCVVFKRFRDRKLIIAAGADEPRLTVLDAETVGSPGTELEFAL